MASQTPRLPAKKLKMERLTAYARPLEFPNEHLRAASADVLFCDACNHTLTWTRKDTVSDHVKSKKHKLSKQTWAEKKRQADRAAMVQSTITQAFGSKNSRDEFIQDFLLSALAGGLSLTVTDTFRPFLNKWCSQAGALPTVSAIRKTHLDAVYTQHQKGLKDKIRGKPINLVFDESCDAMDRSVLNIIGGE